MISPVWRIAVSMDAAVCALAAGPQAKKPVAAEPSSIISRINIGGNDAAYDGSGASEDVADKEFFLKNVSLRNGDFPVESPIEAEAQSAPSAIELPFADSMSQFETGERHGGGDERLESLQWSAPRFDPAVVLLDSVVQVFIPPDAHVAPFHKLPPQPPQRGTSGHVSIEGDGTRKAFAVRVERFAKEGLGRSDSSVAPQQEVDRLPVLVNGSIQVVPVPTNANIRFVAPPRPTDASPESIPALLELRDVPNASGGGPAGMVSRQRPRTPALTVYTGIGKPSASATRIRASSNKARACPAVCRR